MNSHQRPIGAAALAAILAAPAGLLASTAPATAAAPRASVTVTIDAEGVDIFGTVRSDRPARCAADRTVKVFRIIKGEPHLWVTDTTQKQDGQYVWSIGNTGTAGRYYAQVAAKPGCAGDKSPIIRVRRT